MKLNRRKIAQICNYVTSMLCYAHDCNRRTFRIVRNFPVLRVSPRGYASVNSLKGSRRQDLELHPTVKPVAMVADAICDVTHQGDLVLDIFLGSGTSLIAAERVGRVFRGLDIDPAYVDVAIERWERLTGKRAELVCRNGEQCA